MRNKNIFLTLTSIFLGVSLFSAFNSSSTEKSMIKEKAENSVTFGEVSPFMMLTNPNRQHFWVEFSETLSNEAVYNIASPLDPNYSTSICDNVLINGHSISFINQNGVNLRGEPLRDQIAVNILECSQGKYGLHIYINEKLSKNYEGISYKLRLDDTDVITFKEGLTFNDVTLDHDLTLKYFSSINDWKRSDPEDIVDTKENSVSFLSCVTYEPTQDLYYFYARFSTTPADKFIAYAEYDQILDNVYYQGFSLSEINDKYGPRSAFIRFQSARSMRLEGDDYPLYIHFVSEVIKDLPFVDNSSLEFKKDILLPSLTSLDKDYKFYFNVDNNYWLSKLASNVEYEEANLIDVSDVVLDPGSGNYYFVLYFDKPICYHYLPQVNAEIEWLSAVYNIESPAFYYSYSFLQALVYDHIRESVLDYFFINDKSIRELCDLDRDSTTCRYDQSIVVNYCGASFDTTSIQVLFNGTGSNKFDPNKEYTVTIKKGYITPLHQKTTKDVTLDLVSFDSPTNVDEENETKGCKGSITAGTSVLVLAIATASLLTILKKGKKYEL